MNVVPQPWQVGPLNSLNWPLPDRVKICIGFEVRTDKTTGVNTRREESVPGISVNDSRPRRTALLPTPLQSVQGSS